MRHRLPDRKVGKASLTADTGRFRRGSDAPEPGAPGSRDEITRNNTRGSMGLAAQADFPVIAVLVFAPAQNKTWIPGTSPGMTEGADHGRE